MVGSMKNQLSLLVNEKVDVEKEFELKKWKKVDIKKGPTRKLNLFLSSLESYCKNYILMNFAW